MVRGYEANQARLQALSLLGKPLARRCKSHCELCHTHGQKLSITEIAPVPAGPDPDKAVMLCDRCCCGVINPASIDINHWRCLGTAIWSEVPAVQVLAVRMLKQLGNVDWVVELQDQLYLDPEVEAWVALE